MIRKFFLAAAALTVSSSAFAADLPSRARPAAFVPPAPVFSWTGAYFGVNAGYAFDNVRNISLTGNDAISRVPIVLGLVPARTRIRSDGFTGGGQIGYNYEIAGPGFAGLPRFGGGSAALVAGVEADAAYLDSDATLVVPAAPGNPAVFRSRFTGRTDFVGTARARLGVAFGTLLVYGTGGFAYGNANDSFTQFTDTQTFYTGGRSRILTGTAYGGGIEYAIPTASFVNFLHASSVTLKAEFLHYDLGSRAITINATPQYLRAIGRNAPSTFTDRIRYDGNLARVGLNYKLDVLAPAPVVARY